MYNVSCNTTGVELGGHSSKNKVFPHLREVMLTCNHQCTVDQKPTLQKAAPLGFSFYNCKNILGVLQVFACYLFLILMQKKIYSSTKVSDLQYTVYAIWLGNFSGRIFVVTKLVRLLS